MKKIPKNLLLSLIKDDLTNTKLVSALVAIQLDAHNYYLYLSETIFKLMGIENSLEQEEIYSQYVQLTEKVREVEVSSVEMDELAEEIYGFLLIQQIKSHENPPP